MKIISQRKIDEFNKSDFMKDINDRYSKVTNMTYSIKIESGNEVMDELKSRGYDTSKVMCDFSNSKIKVVNIIDVI